MESSACDGHGLIHAREDATRIISSYSPPTTYTLGASAANTLEHGTSFLPLPSTLPLRRRVLSTPFHGLAFLCSCLPHLTWQHTADTALTELQCQHLNAATAQPKYSSITSLPFTFPRATPRNDNIAAAGDHPGHTYGTTATATATQSLGG